jgi:hypothetical protein
VCAYQCSAKAGFARVRFFAGSICFIENGFVFHLGPEERNLGSFRKTGSSLPPRGFVSQNSPFLRQEMGSFGNSRVQRQQNLGSFLQNGRLIPRPVAFVSQNDLPPARFFI